MVVVGVGVVLRAGVSGGGPYAAVHPTHIVDLEPSLHLLVDTHVAVVLLPPDHHTSALHGQQQLPSLPYSKINHRFSQFLAVEHCA